MFSSSTGPKLFKIILTHSFPNSYGLALRTGQQNDLVDTVDSCDY